MKPTPPPLATGATVAFNLQKLMTRQGISAKDLATAPPTRVREQDGKAGENAIRATPPNEKTIRRILAGESGTPRISTLQGLAAALGVTLDQLTAQPDPATPEAPGEGPDLRDTPDEADPEARWVKDERGSMVQKVPLTRITRVRDLETFFGGDGPSVRKLYAPDLSEEDEDWAAEVVDEVVTTLNDFKDRWSSDRHFGEVAKRSLLKIISSKIAERPDICVAMGSVSGQDWDEELTVTYRVLFLVFSTASRPITSCLFNPDAGA